MAKISTTFCRKPSIVGSFIIIIIIVVVVVNMAPTAMTNAFTCYFGFNICRRICYALDLQLNNEGLFIMKY
jgi:hypothetical protein